MAKGSKWNPTRKAKQTLNWAKQKERKAAREAAGEARHKENVKRLKDGLLTPWLEARALRHKLRHPNDEEK